jgi:hypothetical protein
MTGQTLCNRRITVESHVQEASNILRRNIQFLRYCSRLDQGVAWWMQCNACMLSLSGHRLFPRITPDLLDAAAKEAGSYLESSVKDTGRIVYHYNPRSDYEPFGYSLPRHAGTLFSMATLYATAPTDVLLDAMKLSMGYLKERIKDCPHPVQSRRQREVRRRLRTRQPLHFAAGRQLHDGLGHCPVLARDW